MNTLKSTPSQYAQAIRAMLKTRSIEALNQANHEALKSGAITMEQFQAAAQVLAAEILKR